MALLEDGTLVLQKDDGRARYDLKITERAEIKDMKGKRF
jgi:hypothetical protein